MQLDPILSNLINYLNDYDMMDSNVAQQIFNNAIYYNIDVLPMINMIIMIGENRDANALIYTRYVTDQKIDHCINCIFGPNFYLPLMNKRCSFCGIKPIFIFTNNTGVPCGQRVLSNFYIHGNSLIITQKTITKTVVHKFCPNRDLNNWIILKWKRLSFIVLILLQFDLIYDLKLYIMKFLTLFV